MKLRKHQNETSRAIDGIINKTPKFRNIRRLLLSVVAGGGKGSVPVNAGRLVKAGLVDRLAIVVPRQSLQTQCEEVFMDAFFQKLFGVHMKVRAATNEPSPCRGMNGFVTTYQALGVDRYKHCLAALQRERYVLILDEFHHVEEDSPWHQAIEELVAAAEYVIMMSGTLSRANKKKIACVTYRNGYVSLQGDDQTHVIRYTRTDALREQAILPISFHLHDGEFSWKKAEQGRVVSVSSFDQVKKKDRSSALYTALQTEFSEQLMYACLKHWLEYKEKRARAKALFVTAQIGDARRCIDYLQSLGIPALLATSHDSQACRENIDRFKGRAPVLVTIAVAYEGLDVPPVSHVCILTRIRSAEWMEQCVSRATRVDKKSGPYSEQMAHVFAPKDKAFLEFVERIEKEQATRVAPAKDVPLPLFPVDEEETDFEGDHGPKGPCIPVKSQILALSKKIIGGMGPFQDPATMFQPTIMTPKNEEMAIRKKIDKYLKKYAYAQGYEYPVVNKDVKRMFGKARAHMTLEELKLCWERVRQVYPFNDDGQFIPPSRCSPVFDADVKENRVCMKFF